MKRFGIVLCALALLAASVLAAAPPEPRPSVPALKARIHSFLERTLGWQQLDTIRVDSISAPDSSGLRKVRVYLQKGAQHVEKSFYVTGDGRHIIDGDVSVLSNDPYRKTREKIRLEGFPAEGPANAPVTLVEFSDLECPYCKEANTTINALRAQMPGTLRIVFKYYPLTKIHPWSMQAALDAVCVAKQGTSNFWAFEQSVFDHQEELTPEDAATRLHDFALESGTHDALFQSCVASPATKAVVEASIRNGDQVGVESTPTLFINGRIIPGAPNPGQLKLLVENELKYVTAAGHETAAGGRMGAGPGRR